MKIAVTVGGVSIDPSDSLDTLLQSAAPNGGTAVCSRTRLTFEVGPGPARSAVSTIAFDRG